jgi:FtsP/CotA-like multicopper oxidase with cupredoxin domain
MSKQEHSGKYLPYHLLLKHRLTRSRYHAHSEVHRADGLYGGLVIHKPSEPPDNISYQYDKELLFLVGDWYHWPAKKVLINFMDRTSLGTEVRSFLPVL